MPISYNREKTPAGVFYLVSWGGERVIFIIGRVLSHIFGSTAGCHPVLIFMPLARSAACGQSQASACGDEQTTPKVGADTTQKSAMLRVGSSRRRCRGGEWFGHSEALWGFKQKWRSGQEVLSLDSESFLLFFCLLPPPLHFILPPPPRLPPTPPLSPPPPFRLRRFCCLCRCRHVLHPSDIRSVSSHGG